MDITPVLSFQSIFIPKKEMYEDITYERQRNEGIMYLALEELELIRSK